MSIKWWLPFLSALMMLSSVAVSGQHEIKSRFGDWTIAKADDVITLASETSNLGVSCSDATMTYMTIVKVSDPGSIAWRPEVNASYFIRHGQIQTSQRILAFWCATRAIRTLRG